MRSFNLLFLNCKSYFSNRHTPRLLNAKSSVCSSVSRAHLKLRKAPPEYGLYNPLQKASYTAVLFVLAPFVVLTGVALSPGVDAIAHPITWILGGRQFARLWHFSGMILLIGFFLIHVFQVATQGVVNQLRSMITGWYCPEEYQTIPAKLE
ncbi:MAG: cytochrome b/b6 domain-containing protein [Candidatus Eremiobacteraeota bacterium]|nr:cytochrome b/b6 domain-containing protein [Candidatus Eremiobacteraeota bacterium]